MEVIGSIYTGVTEIFQRGICPIARTVKAEAHDFGGSYGKCECFGYSRSKIPEYQ